VPAAGEEGRVRFIPTRRLDATTGHGLVDGLDCFFPFFVQGPYCIISDCDVLFILFGISL
jgi:hypothetical protein